MFSYFTFFLQQEIDEETEFMDTSHRVTIFSLKLNSEGIIEFKWSRYDWCLVLLTSNDSTGKYVSSPWLFIAFLSLIIII